MSSAGRRGLERRPSGTAVSSVVSKFSQKSQDSKDRPQPKAREPLTPRDNVANRLKGPKSSGYQTSLNKSKQNGSQSSIKSTESKDSEVRDRTRNSSVQSNHSRRSSDASTETDQRRESSDASTGTDISIPASPSEDLSPLDEKIHIPKVSSLKNELLQKCLFCGLTNDFSSVTLYKPATIAR